MSKKHQTLAPGLENNIANLESPVKDGQIDQSKLLAAWEEHTGVQREIIRSIQRNEEDNERTRIETKRTRVLIYVSFILALIGAAYVHNRTATILESNQHVLKSNQRMELLISITVEAVAKATEASISKTQADRRGAMRKLDAVKARLKDRSSD